MVKHHSSQFVWLISFAINIVNYTVPIWRWIGFVTMFVTSLYTVQCTVMRTFDLRTVKYSEPINISSQLFLTLPKMAWYWGRGRRRWESRSKNIRNAYKNVNNNQLCWTSINLRDMRPFQRFLQSVFNFSFDSGNSSCRFPNISIIL